MAFFVRAPSETWHEHHATGAYPNISKISFSFIETWRPCEFYRLLSLQFHCYHWI